MLKLCFSLAAFIVAASFSKAWAEQPMSLPRYEITVALSPAARSLTGHARITFPDGYTGTLRLGATTVHSVKLNNSSQDIDEKTLERLLDGKGEKILEIEFSATFSSPAPATGSDIGSLPPNIIDPSGVTLVSGWYPEVSSLCDYSLTVEAPSDFQMISEGEEVTVHRGEQMKRLTFHFPGPLPRITLVAARYSIRQESFRGVLLKTYLRSDDPLLSEAFFEYTKSYLALYESLVGAFPYRGFAIVEGMTDTIYSFPTYASIGARIMKSPALLATSLGHEIFHQWFGHSVFVDERRGSWAEGLTTYLSEHWLEHLKGTGAEFRKRLLIDYANYVSPASEISLREFAGQRDPSSRAIGYGKAAMLFHMLRIQLGDDLFFKTLRDLRASHTFQFLSWDDLLEAFGKESGKDLTYFLPDWVERKGAPTISAGGILSVYRQGQYVLDFDITQTGDAYRVRLPVIVTSEQSTRLAIDVSTAALHHSEKLADKPLSLSLDEGYDVMRRLAPPEIPPVISAFEGAKDSIVVLPEGGSDIYRAAEEFFESTGYTVKEAKNVTEEDLRTRSFLFLSEETGLFGRLFAGTVLPEGGFSMTALSNPFNRAKVMIVFKARNEGEFMAAFRKMSQYGNYSAVVFENGVRVSAATGPSRNGISFELSPPPTAIATKDVIGLDEVILGARLQKIVCIGEVHSEYGHHLMQFEMIRRLHQLNGRMVIGMEMFQRPFQQYLDQFIGGEINEEEFLKKSEYFSRWAFNYNLYRDILNYARANRIPVIALNLRKEIIEKVSRGGLESLSDEEFSEIPKMMDLTNSAYKDFLWEIFSRHAGSAQKDFGNFLQSQVLWDETMAMSIAESLEKYPDSQLIVLAGNGHFMNSWGIPDRVRRLSGITPMIIHNSGGERVTQSIADYILYPEDAQAPAPPLLNVVLQKAEHGLLVERILEGGAAERAGLRKGDVILVISGRPVDGVDDVKIALLDRKPGDTVVLQIMRKRFLFGDKKMELPVELLK